jgi:aspartate racemase
MKTIGLIGGTSWESSLEYYRLLNQGARERLGGLHSARCLLYSLDFAPVEAGMRASDWQSVAQELARGAMALEQGGADFFLLCSNTTHKCAEQVAGAVSIPLLHIGRATGHEARRLGFSRLGLLGTRFVMEDDFMTGYLERHFEQSVLVPEAEARLEVNRIIFEELCLGTFSQRSKQFLQACIDGLADRGAEGVVLGCTEIPLLITAGDSRLPILDTTSLHAAAALQEALEV